MKKLEPTTRLAELLLENSMIEVNEADGDDPAFYVSPLVDGDGEEWNIRMLGFGPADRRFMICVSIDDLRALCNWVDDIAEAL